MEGSTVTRKLVLALAMPSLTLTVISVLPTSCSAGTTIIVRFESEPPKRILLLGTREGLDDAAESLMLAASNRESPMLKESGPTQAFGSIRCAGSAAIVGEG